MGHDISLDKVMLGQQLESLIVHVRIVWCKVGKLSWVSGDDPDGFPGGEERVGRGGARHYIGKQT